MNQTKQIRYLLARLRDPEMESIDVGISGVAWELTDENLCDDAADAIERLEADNQTMIEALEHIAIMKISEDYNEEDLGDAIAYAQEALENIKQ